MFSVFLLKTPPEFWNFYSDLSIHETLLFDLVDIKTNSQHAVKNVLEKYPNSEISSNFSVLILLLNPMIPTNNQVISIIVVHLQYLFSFFRSPDTSVY